MKALVIALIGCMTLIVVSAQKNRTIAFPLVGGQQCGAGCDRCALSDNEKANNCMGLSYVFNDAGTSRPGCCFSSANPSCPSQSCKWVGNLSILNNSGITAGITIQGPGTDKICPVVPPGSFCTKSFDDGPTNPAIVAACPKGSQDVHIAVLLGGACWIKVEFKCGDGCALGEQK